MHCSGGHAVAAGVMVRLGEYGGVCDEVLVYVGSNNMDMEVGVIGVGDAE